MSDLISVTSNGVDIKNASTKDILLSSQYPLMKLDQANQNSFQNVSLFFNNEPPDPAPSNSNSTLVYKFSHGYSYTPSVWAFCEAVGVTIHGTFQTTYFNDSGLIGGSNTGVNVSYTTITTGVDSTYYYVYVNKFINSTGTTAHIAGATLNFRFYVFADDLSGTMVPLHA